MQNDGLHEKWQYEWETFLNACKENDIDKLNELIQEWGKPPNFVKEKNATLLDMLKLYQRAELKIIDAEIKSTVGEEYEKYKKDKKQTIEAHKKINKIIKQHGGTSTSFFKKPLIAAPAAITLGFAIAANTGLVAGTIKGFAVGTALLISIMPVAGLLTALSAPVTLPTLIVASLMCTSSGTVLGCGIAISIGLLCAPKIGSFPSSVVEFADGIYQSITDKVASVVPEAAAVKR